MTKNAMKSKSRKYQLNNKYPVYTIIKAQALIRGFLTRKMVKKIWCRSSTSGEVSMIRNRIGTHLIVMGKWNDCSSIIENQIRKITWLGFIADFATHRATITVSSRLFFITNSDCTGLPHKFGTRMATMVMYW